MLDAARSGWPFGELCELLCEELGRRAAAAQAATLLRGWVPRESSSAPPEGPPAPAPPGARRGVTIAREAFFRKVPHATVVYTNVLEMIGNTPLVDVTHLDTGPCQLFLKLENQNPGGSIKDRIGLYDDRGRRARRARSKPGGTLVEATAGNTGLGLALVARAEGLPRWCSSSPTR